MMKRLLATTAALALVGLYGAGAYAADNDSGVMNMSGDVEDTCSLGDGTQGAVTNAAYSTGDLTVTALANGTTAVGQAFSAAVNFVAVCNFAHSVELASSSNGMIVDAVPTAVHGTFDYRVNYTATMSHSVDADCAAGVVLATNGALTSNTGAAVDDSANVDAACNGTLTVTIATGAGTNPLLTGGYADTLTLTVGPEII